MLWLSLLILIPLFEIYLFIKVGDVIGAGPTVLMVILTAVIGIAMLRVQGLDTLARFRNASSHNKSPALELLGGILLLLGGTLLLTPGFFTDAVGFLCLLRTTRMWMVRYMVEHAIYAGTGFTWKQRRRGPGHPSDHRPRTLEGKFRGHDLED